MHVYEWVQLDVNKSNIVLRKENMHLYEWLKYIYQTACLLRWNESVDNTWFGPR